MKLINITTFFKKRTSNKIKKFSYNIATGLIVALITIYLNFNDLTPLFNSEPDLRTKSVEIENMVVDYNEPVDTRITDAEIAYKADNFKKSLSHINSIFESSSMDLTRTQIAQMRLLQGFCYFKLKKHEKSLISLKQSFDVIPSKSAYRLTAKIYSIKYQQTDDKLFYNKQLEFTEKAFEASESKNDLSMNVSSPLDIKLSKNSEATRKSGSGLIGAYKITTKFLLPDDNIKEFGQYNNIFVNSEGKSILSFNHGKRLDAIRGNTESDFVYGTLGKDTLFGNSGNNIIGANRGNDTLAPTVGNNSTPPNLHSFKSNLILAVETLRSKIEIGTTGFSTLNIIDGNSRWGTYNTDDLLNETFIANFDFDESTHGNIYIISVGINNFADEKVTALRFAEKDSNDVIDSFKSVFRNKLIHYNLTGSDASKENILSKIRLINKKAGVNDRIIFYYSGHGVLTTNDIFNTTNKSNFIMPVDVTINNLESTAISLAEITNIVGSKYRKIKPMLLLDSCNDPTLSKMFRSIETRASEDSYQTLVISSASQGQKSNESYRLKNGVFTHYLTKRISNYKSLDRDSDNVISIKELLDPVQLELTEYLKNTNSSQKINVFSY